MKAYLVHGLVHLEKWTYIVADDEAFAEKAFVDRATADYGNDVSLVDVVGIEAAPEQQGQPPYRQGEPA